MNNVMCGYIYVCIYIYVYTVDSRYNEPRREMKISSLYREFVKSKMEKIGNFCANINSYLRVVKLYIFSN